MSQLNLKSLLYSISNWGLKWHANRTYSERIVRLRNLWLARIGQPEYHMRLYIPLLSILKSKCLWWESKRVDRAIMKHSTAVELGSILSRSDFEESAFDLATQVWRAWVSQSIWIGTRIGRPSQSRPGSPSPWALSECLAMRLDGPLHSKCWWGWSPSTMRYLR